jgi:chromosome partitioning protein
MAETVNLPVRRLKAVIAVAQDKGGVGKTTLTRTLGEYFSFVRGLKVLLIDFDAQCSLSKLCLPGMEVSTNRGARPPVHPDYNAAEDGEWSGRSSVYDLFVPGDTGVVPYPVQRPEGVEGLDIVPADGMRIPEIEEQNRTALKENVENRLREWVALPEVQEAYDVIIVDTAPSQHPLTRTALRGATHLLIPIQMEEQCIDGLHGMLTMWRTENTLRSPDDLLEIVAMQPNNVRGNYPAHQSLLNDLRRNESFKGFLSPVVIPSRHAYTERDMRGASPRSIFEVKPSVDARKVAMEFCEYIERRAFGTSADRKVKHGS